MFSSCIKVSLLMLLLTGSTGAKSVNKCCPAGEHFKDTLLCEKVEGQVTLIDDDFVQQNFGDYSINYGRKPFKDDRIKLVTVGSFNLTEDGNLVTWENGRNTTFSKKSFCIESDHYNYTDAYICPCLNHLCIKKCCLPGNHINMTTDPDGRVVSSTCSTNTNDTEDWHYGLLNGSRITRSHELVYSLVQCKYKDALFLKGNLKLRDDGYIISDIDGALSPEDYCGDYRIINEELKESVILGCLSSFPVIQKSQLIYGFCSAVGAIILIYTTFSKSRNPDLSPIFSNSLSAHTGSLALAYIAVVIGSFNNIINLNACVVIGYIMQWSFLAAFFWLNVMCIDMSWTFSGLRPPSGSQRDRDRRKFIWYSIYAWVGPSALTAAALIVEYSPGVSEDSPFKPNVGAIKCWFRDNGALWLYFYGPMAILLLTNLVLFVYTSFRILILRRETGAIRHPDSARHGGGSSNKEKQRFILYAKLFSLMGITWVTEIISWAVGGPNYIWYFTDAINLLRAVFIFIIFCWKPRVWTAIKKRLGCVRKCEMIASRLCCGKVLQFDSQDDPKTGSTSTSGQKDTNSKTDAVEMQNP